MIGLWKNSWLTFLLALLFSCNSEPEETRVSSSFYHWKSTYANGDNTMAYLNELQSEKIFVRYFDVVLEDGELVPVATVERGAPINRNLEIVPVVYITNAAMKAVKPENIPILAQRIFKKIKSTHPWLSNNSIREIQIDCDWTGNSRDNFFDLLNSLKGLLDQNTQHLSCTLRLHQYNAPEVTGIPPVDKVMLMFYNMGEVNDFNEVNSIINLEAAAQYLTSSKSYPLPMDMALPLFQWGCVFRDQKLVHLTNNLTIKELQDEKRFLEISPNRFQVIKSTYLQGYFLYDGDEIRHESVSYQQLHSAAKMLAGIKNNRETTLAFYHLDSLNLEKFSPDQLNRIMTTIKKGN